MQKKNILIVGLIVVAILGSASGWVYHAVSNKNNSPVSQAELMNLQVSFIKQYGIKASVNQVIIPKIYELAWNDEQGNTNVSLNIGGVWVAIASLPPKTP